MKIIKSDWMLLREAEENGLSVSMNCVIERNRTELNKRLSNYFLNLYPNFKGIYDEYQFEDIMWNINKYIDNKELKVSKLDYYVPGGNELYLIPITTELKLKVLVSDEYFGNGDYDKSIMIDRFIITEKATEKDVDQLIQMLNEYELN